MIPQQLANEVEQLRLGGHQVELIEAEGWLNVVFSEHSLRRGYNAALTDLLTRMPISYPHGRPDMFWTSPGLLLADGRIPRAAESIETALGKPWRRFSWHPATWNPGSDSLLTYLEFIDRRLGAAE